MGNTLYYSHNGKGPGIARIVDETDELVYLEIKSGDKSKRWSKATLTKLAFSRSGWKKRAGR